MNLELVYITLVGICEFYSDDSASSNGRSSVLKMSSLMENEEANFIRVETNAQIECFMQAKFQKIMELDGISNDEITSSLAFSRNREQLFKAGKGAGKSGSFFFFSSDRKFVIKTVSKSEKDLLLSMLDDLIQHYTDTDNKSLIARIYGVLKVTSKSFSPFYIVIM